MASHARHSKRYLNDRKQGGTIVSPTRRMIAAGLLAATVIPAIAGNAYAEGMSSAPVRHTVKASTGDAKATVMKDGTIASVRSFVGTRAGRSDFLSESTQAASRSEARGVVNDADWGGIEKIEIVQTKSTAQQDATRTLQDAINAAQPTLDSSEGKADDADRKALQDAINESKGMADDVSVSADSLNAQAAKLNDATKRVADAVNAYNARIAAAEAARSNRPSNRRGYASQPSQPQWDYDAWVAGHPDSPMGQKVLEYAKQFNGYPYVWAAAGPNAFDCSGLVMYVYAHFGVSLGHYSGSQMGAGTGVSDINHAAYGDIIASTSHAALFAGFDSDGEPIVFNALNPSAGVTFTKLKYAFPNGYVIRRIFN